MGAPEAFEHRRRELAELNSPSDDEDVVKSFLDMVSPGGYLADYLQLSDLGLIFGDTLFIHGGVHDYNLWYVPAYGDQPEFQRKPDHNLKDWTDALNAFSHFEAKDYVDNVVGYVEKIHNEGAPVWSSLGGYDQLQPGSRLLHCGMGAMPDLSVNRSVIYSSYIKEGRAHEPDDVVIKALNESGIKRIVVGHQPIGDVPLVLKVIRPDVGFLQILCCDTSYAANVKWEASDVQINSVVQDDVDGGAAYTRPCPKNSTRGVAVAELVLQVSGSSSKGYIHGVMSNGCPYEYDLPTPGDEAADVGSLLLNQWLVRAVVQSTYAVVQSANKVPSPEVIERSSDIVVSPDNVLVNMEGADVVVDEKSERNKTTTDTEHNSANANYLITKQEGYTVVNQLVSRATLEDMKARSANLPAEARMDLNKVLLQGIQKTFTGPKSPTVDEAASPAARRPLHIKSMVAMITGMQRAVRSAKGSLTHEEAASPPTPPPEPSQDVDIESINKAYHDAIAKVHWREMQAEDGVICEESEARLSARELLPEDMRADEWTPSEGSQKLSSAKYSHAQSEDATGGGKTTSLYDMAEQVFAAFNLSLLGVRSKQK